MLPPIAELTLVPIKILFPVPGSVKLNSSAWRFRCGPLVYGLDRKPGRGAQPIVASRFDDASFFEHDDLFRMAHGRQTVCNRDHCAMSMRGKHCGKSIFSLRVECAGCFIEQEGSRVTQDSPARRQPLPLATGNWYPRSPTSV